MPAVNVYVPKRLRERMDAREGVNWSRLACRAFEEGLSEAQGRKCRKKARQRVRAAKMRGLWA